MDILKEMLKAKMGQGSGDVLAKYLLAGSVERAKMFIALFQQVANLTHRVETLEQSNQYKVSVQEPS